MPEPPELPDPEPSDWIPEPPDWAWPETCAGAGGGFNSSLEYRITPKASTPSNTKKAYGETRATWRGSFGSARVRSSDTTRTTP